MPLVRSGFIAIPPGPRPGFDHADIYRDSSGARRLYVGAAWWKLGRGAWPDILAVSLVSGVSVFLWRVSANMPQLNEDGLPGFSANDWAAPILTYVSLGIYSGLKKTCRGSGFREVRALATLACLVINVVTI